MAANGHETTSGARPVFRWVLAAAALIAASAVGYSLIRDDGTAELSAGAPDASAQPSVSDVIARLERKLAENPGDAEGWRMLGWSYFQIGRHAEAATALKRATSLAPGNAEYHSMLGEALVLASQDGDGLPADARAAFERALALDPSDPRARYFRAVAMDLEGRHEAAIDAWFELLGDTPADAPWAADVRQVIVDVAQANGIDVAERLAATPFAPPTGDLRTDGAAVATGAIPGPTREQMQAAQTMSRDEQDAMVRGMVDRLSARLADNPNDADGWIMLMRSRVQLGDRGGARRALEDGLAAFRTDAATSRRLREAAGALDIPAG